MRGRIAFPVPVGSILRDSPLQGVDYIAGHIRVGIFVDGDGGGSVRCKNDAVAVPDIFLFHCIAHGGGNIKHFYLRICPDIDFFHGFTLTVLFIFSRHSETL